MAAVFDLLSNETLQHILGYLPPANLVRLRSVCQRWRSAINAIEDDDRPYKFVCGATLRPFVEHDDEEAAEDNDDEDDIGVDEVNVDEPVADVPVSHLFDEHDKEFKWYCLWEILDFGGRFFWPCSCGRLLAIHSPQDISHTDLTRHQQEPPLQRWRAVNGDRDIALSMLQKVERVDSRMLSHHGFGYNGSPRPWHMLLHPVRCMIPLGRGLALLLSHRQMTMFDPKRYYVDEDGVGVDADIAQYHDVHHRIDGLTGSLVKQKHILQKWLSFRADAPNNLDNSISAFFASANNSRQRSRYGDVEPYLYGVEPYMYGELEPYESMTAEQFTQALHCQIRATKELCNFARGYLDPVVLMHIEGLHGALAVVGLSPGSHVVGVSSVLDWR